MLSLSLPLPSERNKSAFTSGTEASKRRLVTNTHDTQKALDLTVKNSFEDLL
jgi:hypothetical protein